jgi:hypothetical protein
VQLRKSNHKFFWKEFEHPLDGPKVGIHDVFHKKKPLATMFFIQLLLRFSRVKLDSLEARLRPVEQLDKDVEFVTR